MKQHKIPVDWLIPYIILALSWSWYTALSDRASTLFS